MDDLLKKALGERAVLRKLPRLLRDMLLVVCLLSLSLLKAQADPQKQKISVDMSDATVEEVLQSIEEKSDYYFLYNSRLINVERRVNVQAKNKPVAAILDDLFISKNVNYQVKGTQIILSPKNMRTSIRPGVPKPGSAPCLPRRNQGPPASPGTPRRSEPTRPPTKAERHTIQPEFFSSSSCQFLLI